MKGIREEKSDKDNDTSCNFFTQPINSEIVEKEDFYNKIIEKQNDNIHVHGGRSDCIKTLTNLHKFKDYETERHFPSKSGTTDLSAHIKFGTCSNRCDS
jgi:deoxyribodipyrimidine photolyase